MIALRLSAISILIVLGGRPLYAQAADDLFRDIHSNLLRATDRELQQVETGSSVAAVYEGRTGLLKESAEGGVPKGSVGPSLKDDRRPATIESPQVQIGGIGDPGFSRLQQFHPLMAPIFAAEGVPHEFLLVGLIESAYRNDAVSPAQAVGMWQFIPSTARRFGLMNEFGDYRTDFERSTRAAARYLRFLLDKFSDWRLALAAYNAGEDRVERAIKVGRTRDFSRLSDMRLLPEETRNYVPSVLRAIAEARNLGVLQ